LLPGARGDLSALQNLPRYTIQVDVNYDARTFQGREQVDYTNNERTPLDRLYFRLFPNGDRTYGDGSLTVTQVTVDGQSVETQLSLEDTVLEVRLPRILKVGEKMQIELEFAGVVPEDFGGPENPTGYGIYNFSDGVLALSGWYPILAVFDDEGWNLDPVYTVGDSVYSDAAFYTVDVTVRSDLVLVATGVEVHRQGLNGTTRYRFVSGPARDFFMIMSPDFQVVSEMVDGTTVNSYYLPQHERGGRRALEVAVGALRTFNERFGPYPYTELEIVDAPMRNAGGVEYPGIVLVADFLYDRSQQLFFSVATAHEVAHQWWYNVVGNDVIDEPWLDEALTTFSSGLYFEAVRGPAAYQELRAQWQRGYEQIVERGEDDLVTLGLPHFEGRDEASSYGVVVYWKGALFFQAVRDAIGDEAFFRALRNYYATHKYKIATPEDLLNAFEEAAGRQLDGLYQEWLYSAKS
jgi:aminopeptidase N